MVNRRLQHWAACFGLLLTCLLGGQGFVLAQSPSLDRQLSLFLESGTAEMDARAQSLAYLLDAQIAALPDGTPTQRIDALFRGLRAKTLKQYVEATDLRALLDEGKFNCVTATALMALALDRAGYAYELREQETHVYLYAVVGTERIRIETTAEDLGVLRQRHLKEAVGGKPDRRKGFQERSMTLDQLAGLQYYNLGLAEMDRDQPVAAFDRFQKAYGMYPCSRIGEMVEESAEACIVSGRKALLEGDLSAALGALDRGVLGFCEITCVRAGAVPHSVRDDGGSAVLLLSAAVLKHAENQPLTSMRLAVLREYAGRHPLLLHESHYRAAYGDVLLLRAHELYQNPEAAGEATGLVEELIALHAQGPAQVDPQIAAAAFTSAFRHALRQGDMARADHYLEMGIALAPADADLRAKRNLLARD